MRESGIISKLAICMGGAFLAACVTSSSFAGGKTMSAPLGIESKGPNCGTVLDEPWREVWLGHFAGGRTSEAGALLQHVQWQDRYVCFPSRATCEQWIKGMRKDFSDVEGYRTCVPIRSGPVHYDWVYTEPEDFHSLD
jgi:hypothetical protein